MINMFRYVFSFVWLLVAVSSFVDAADYIATATLITNTKTGQAGSTPGGTIVGTITFTQRAGENTVTIDGYLKLAAGFSLTNNSLGFHVHQTSNFTNGCDSAGSHYNPENKTHGGPNDTIRHVGDLGMIAFNPNSLDATVHTTDNVISLVGKHSIIGRSLVLHNMADDLGRGGNEESLKTGNADGRYACGPIVLANDFSSGSESVLKNGPVLLASSLMALLAYYRLA
jgi:Cu-Zn family superoxide dismutase